MKTILSLSLIAILPVICSVLLKIAFDHGKLSHKSYTEKQTIIGIIFGILAIFGTEFGVPIEGATINARDAAPLCAALIFGAPAGIIAGIIGGFERWFAVYWGAGYYTRAACAISTITIGIAAGIMRKKIFDNKVPHFTQAFVIAIVCEVFHMLMIFITNMLDIKNAFYFVEACSIPMILVNGVAVAGAVYLINVLDKGKTIDFTNSQTLSVKFQKQLTAVVLVAFVATTVFAYSLQSEIAKNDTKNELTISINDVVNNVVSQCDESLLKANKLVVSDLRDNPEADLIALRNKYGVKEIHIIDEHGIIIASTDEKYLNYDMSYDAQSAQFLTLLETSKTEMVQAYMPTSYDKTVYRKYSGVVYNRGFVQVAYDGEEIANEIGSSLIDAATYRHIGESGSIIVLDQDSRIVSATQSFIDNSTEDDVFDFNENNNEEYVMYEGKINNVPYYYMFTRTENYLVLGIIPQSEANISKNISTYLNFFMETLIFGSIFVLIYFVIKNLVVDNMTKVNEKLELITDGQLDTVVDIEDSKEFEELSSGINTTVDALKQYIKEASERIDAELKYAQEIQFSALPSQFPAFPDRHEFDIYALMDPAKEVGGDFYDFYMINEHTLVFLVADVAGKGIPASLFMMRAKTTLKTYAENDVDVADIFTNANYQLCEGNDADMFVTAWMGFLDLRTGKLTYANAGHNRPLIKRKDGKYEYLTGPAGFVLAGMEGIVYKQQSLTLNPGDEIFLYTDGVVEATNVDKQLYGDDRLENRLNSISDYDSHKICDYVKENVDEFYEGAPQFDDITELSVRFLRYMDNNEESH